ncbi:sugar ABC transporter substrate-binding protein [Micromonospora purpureochromogenes]|uniref:D-xylose transport system substrate-binding protein n=1 Tax=Micromonospora purpureochromogenes TaxID=47872 RepID=A0ABX2RJ71_9ACTN|nr:substrate-binding domain-containing protein [Micromonospora purpureochromogenes]NYF55226.1 D-xylose transport system substrate-binding protein [Micromonospora purpureochromogenes]
MRKGLLALTVVGLLAGNGVAGCGDQLTSGSAADGARKPKIGVILPDSKSSARWEGADRRFLEEAFDAAGIDSDIQNAQGDKSQFSNIAEQMITNGATVLMIVNLDSGTGKAVLEKARSQGIATIDYDRLTLGGSAQYYVSFDNEAVGKLQGQGLAKCLTEKGARKPVVAFLNGSPTDNNATLFKAGYDSILKPKFDAEEFRKGPDQWVPDWNNAQAGVIFEQMLTQTEGRIDGVLAANDGLGNAAISVLKKNKLNGRIPVTGQDATAQGLRNILAGDQCMTVYKAIKDEAKAAADLAIALANGERKETGQTVRDPESDRAVDAILLTPKAIYADDVADVIADGFVTKDEVCSGEYAKLCAAAGVN